MKIVRKISGEEADGSSIHRAAPWKVLVVDDEPDIRRLTTLNLRGFEFAGRRLELIEAGSAAEAREQLKQHPDIGLVLMDIMMPEMDGYEVCRRLKQTTPDSSWPSTSAAIWATS